MINSKMMHSLKSKQQAFTLIEYMVAILLGLILLGGLTYLFIGMKRSNDTQSSIAQMQESGRFAMYYLTNDIQYAGWANVEEKGYGFYTSPAFDFAGGTTDGGSAAASDSIRIRYEAPTDCLGNASGGIVENRYYVDSGQLMCQGVAGDPQPLISNVDALHFLYGIDTDGDTVPNKFVRADQVATNERESIAAVKVMLILSSSNDIRPDTNAQSFSVMGHDDTYDVNDKKARKIFSTTISVPNKPEFVITT
ncbi:hypothetical protein CW740_04565 [Kangiella profundi]|uniref:Uncharacterized protein n=1 Tax=Kangiella profundi TaxID=1561924 RepID=A0A2K9AUE1_9GAMM|nr:PilW family protein [Kangiella profundi]AUD80043.1 hypothetical protein CW740_04565 [Kangiella profundi]GGF08981.1 hypothetical protein GCM10011356_23090 [Kangiella profundi]